MIKSQIAAPLEVFSRCFVHYAASCPGSWPLILFATVVLVGVVDVVRRDAVLVAALGALPGVFVVIESVLVVQVRAAAVAVPVYVGESLAHSQPHFRSMARVLVRLGPTLSEL